MAQFESIPASEGLNTPAGNPCKLLGFDLLMLRNGEEYQGSTQDREYCAVLLIGKGTFVINSREFRDIGGRQSVFQGRPHSVYIPCHSTYTVKAQDRLELALCSAPSEATIDPYVIPPDRVATVTVGAANFLRHNHPIMTLGYQPDLPAQRLCVGETYVPSGNWATYPPHKHERDELPREAYHEEIYYFKVNPPEGFGMTRHYSGASDRAHVIQDNTVLMAPNGYHTVVSAPGYTVYYLWFLAGNQRVLATTDDPKHSWVARTVPMLKALGH